MSKYNSPFRKVYKSELRQEILKNIEIDSGKPPTYTLNHDQDENLRGKFHQKELIKVFQQWTRSH